MTLVTNGYCFFCRASTTRFDGVCRGCEERKQRDLDAIAIAKRADEDEIWAMLSLEARVDHLRSLIYGNS